MIGVFEKTQIYILYGIQQISKIIDCKNHLIDSSKMSYTMSGTDCMHYRGHIEMNDPNKN